MIVKEELGADVVSTFIQLGFEVVELPDSIGGFGVTFAEACDANGQFVGQILLVLPCTDESDEVGCVFETLLARVGIAAFGGIASQGEEGACPCLRVGLQSLLNFCFAVTRAGKMGYGGDATVLYLGDKVVGEGAGAAVGTIGNTDETWIELLKFDDGVE